MSDLDPLISEAMARVKHPTDARPSISGVHRRARRSNRRRMTATVGAVACTGVATAALMIRRDSDSTRTLASGQPDATDAGIALTATPAGFDSHHDPADPAVGAPHDRCAPGLGCPRESGSRPVGNADGTRPRSRQCRPGQMPTAKMFGCTTDACATLFNYVVWHQIASMLGFFDVQQMRDMNSGIDFSLLPQEGEVLQTVYSSFAGPPPPNPGDRPRRRSACSTASC